MAKKARVWDGSSWIDLASSVTDLSAYQTTARTGSISVVPTSVSVGSGSGSVGSNGAVTFSGASSISLNGCFSSTYENYLVQYNMTSGSATGVNIRYRTSGTDNSGTGYIQGGYWVGVANSLALATVNNSTLNYFGLHTMNATYGGFGTLNIISPYESKYTKGSFTGGGYDNGCVSCIFNATTSFDGFTIYPSSGTVTGTLRVYGYNNN